MKENNTHNIKHDVLNSIKLTNWENTSWEENIPIESIIIFAPLEQRPLVEVVLEDKG